MNQSSSAVPRNCEILEALNLTGPVWCMVLSVAGDGPELMAACARLGLEGRVAARSVFRPGERSRGWVKAAAKGVL